MARTSAEIKQAIIDKIATDPILSTELTSLSKTAFYNLIADLFSDVASWLEVSFDTFATNLQESLLNQRVGTAPFYIERSKAFQFGDTVVEDGNGNYKYEVIDEDKQIIKRVAFISAAGINLLKVATVDGGGGVIPLSSPQLAAFKSYWETVDFKPSFLDPGQSFISANGDDIKATLTVELDPQLFNTATGELLTTGEKSVETAINNYLTTFTDTDFDGTFYISELVSKVKAVNGVINALVDSVEAKPDTEPTYTDIKAETGEKYNTFAGYFKEAVLTMNYE